MRLINPKLAIALGGLTLVLASACSNDTGSTTGALVTGRVEGEGAGSTVRAYSVENDGELALVSGGAQVDADGRYALRVDPIATTSIVIVRVEDGSGRMVATSRAAVEAVGEGELVLAPIDAETTFAASVEIEMEARGDVMAEEHALTELFLAPGLSRALATSDASVRETARAVSEANATFREGLAYGGGDLDVVLDGALEAQTQFDAELDGNTDPAQVTARYAAYVDAVIGVTEDAGYSMREVAIATLSASSVLESRLGAEAGSAYATLDVTAAYAVTGAVEASIGDIVDGSDLSAAGDTLRDELITLSAEGGARADVDAAWARYNAAVNAQIESSLGLAGSVLTGVIADIETARATLLAAWGELSASASARIEATLAFLASVESSVHLEVLAGAGLDSERASATLEALAIVSLSTR
ncbi:MAG: hypothetical protein AB7S26_22505 [Sandaracinaceae bacterium]